MKKTASFLPVVVLVLSFSLLSSCSSTAQQNTPTASTQGYQNVDVATFKKLMVENPEAVLLDVRTPPEVAQQMIEGAINIDFRSPNFNDQVAQLDKDKTYLVYCRSGQRSASACQMMSKAGFKDLYNLQGGILAWSATQ